MQNIMDSASWDRDIILVWYKLALGGKGTHLWQPLNTIYHPLIMFDVSTIWGQSVCVSHVTISVHMRRSEHESFVNACLPLSVVFANACSSISWVFIAPNRTGHMCFYECISMSWVHKKAQIKSFPNVTNKNATIMSY